MSDLHGTNYEATVVSYKWRYTNCYIQLMLEDSKLGLKVNIPPFTFNE